jgi:hypothetical protein
VVLLEADEEAELFTSHPRYFRSIADLAALNIQDES